MQKKSLCLGMALVPMGVATAIAQQAQRPNIMLIVVDDMGYSDLQCFGGEVQLPVLLGDEQAEFYVIAPSAEGGRYGFSFTGNSPFDFTAGTIGLNLRAESNQDGCIAQTYAAANGTNHRSFWTLQEIDASILNITNTKLPYSNLIYDLQGRRLNSMNTKGIYIVNGRRILKY